jgi:hypothetical protein
MPLEPGWEVSKDRVKDYDYFRVRYFEPLESPILTTPMKKAAKTLGMKQYGDGFAVLTDKKFYFRRRHSAGMAALEIINMLRLDNLATFDNPEWEDRIPLQQIVDIAYKGNGKYILRWMQVDKQGTPKVDKKGNYKTNEAEFQVLKNKGEEKSKHLERREQFGPFLQGAIKKLKEKSV